MCSSDLYLAISLYAGLLSYTAGKQPAGKGRKRDGPTSDTIVYASLYCRCLYNIAFWEVREDVVVCEDNEGKEQLTCWCLAIANKFSWK